MTRGLVEIPLSAASNFGWMETASVQEIVAALENASPGSVRFVGGCVRDSLLGKTPKDIDIAETLTPDDVVGALSAAGLRSAPTGLDHGTVTAIAEDGTVEVTTLRSDVSTDGRRATVAFTKDWNKDANRRDFTINAIYLTPDKRLYDPVGGLADIENRRVRFIGDARARIREDFLRILRFFRFSTRFADEIDADGLAACRAEREGVRQLSAERIGAEFLAILSLPNAAQALQWMLDANVLTEIWSAPANIDAVAKLKTIAPRAHPCVALAALYGDAGEGVGARLRLSNAEKSIRSNALRCAAEVGPAMKEKALRRKIYGFGRTSFRDGLHVAASSGAIDETALRRYEKFLTDWTPPEFPLSGGDIVARGVAPGPAVAKILKAVESQWVDEDFPDAERLDVILSEAVDRSTD